MVNQKTFEKSLINNNYLPLDVTKNMSFKPAPNAIKIYNDFKQDQHETFYYSHNKE